MPHPLEQLEILSAPIDKIKIASAKELANFLRTYHKVSNSEVSAASNPSVSMAIRLITQYGYEGTQSDLHNFLFDFDELEASDKNSEAWANKLDEIKQKYLIENENDPARYPVNIPIADSRLLIQQINVKDPEAIVTLRKIKNHIMIVADLELSTSGVAVFEKINSVAKYFKDASYKLTLPDDKENAINYLKTLKLDDNPEIDADKKRILLEMVLQYAMEEKKSPAIIANILQLKSVFEENVNPTSRNTFLTKFYTHAIEMALRNKQSDEVMMQIMSLAMENLTSDLSKEAFISLVQGKLPPHFMEEFANKNNLEIEKNKKEAAGLLRSIRSTKEIIGDELFAKYNADLQPFIKASRDKNISYVSTAENLRQMNEEIKPKLAIHLNKQIEVLNRKLQSIKGDHFSNMDAKKENPAATNQKLTGQIQEAREDIQKAREQLHNPHSKAEDYAKSIEMLDQKIQQFDVERKKRPVFSRIAEKLNLPGFSQNRNSKDDMEDKKPESSFFSSFRRKGS